MMTPVGLSGCSGSLRGARGRTASDVLSVCSLESGPRLGFDGSPNLRPAGWSDEDEKALAFSASIEMRARGCSTDIPTELTSGTDRSSDAYTASAGTTTPALHPNAIGSASQHVTESVG